MWFYSGTGGEEVGLSGGGIHLSPRSRPQPACHFPTPEVQENGTFSHCEQEQNHVAHSEWDLAMEIEVSVLAGSPGIFFLSTSLLP